MNIKYDKLAERNSHMWLLIKLDNQPDKVLKEAYASVIETMEYLQENSGKYEEGLLGVMIDNLECMHYGICTMMDVPLDVQIKMVNGGLVG